MLLWAVAASVTALWDLYAACVVCVGGAFSFGTAISLAERRWWVASGNAALGGMLVLNLVTTGNHSQVEHDVVGGVSLAALAYCATAIAANRKTRNRRGKPPL